MTNEQAMEMYEKLVERYGDQLPNPIQEPQRFEYYVKLYSWNELVQKLTVDSKPKG